MCEHCCSKGAGLLKYDFVECSCHCREDESYCDECLHFVLSDI
jgi:hypothetical protein